jgi:hypothetical protein
MSRGRPDASTEGQGPTMVMPRVNILGVGVSAINMTMALHTIDEWIARHEAPTFVSPESMASWKPARCRAAADPRTAGLVTPDGMRWSG